MAMLEGRAIGGPRNNVKLSAGRSWNGRVERPRIATATISYYPGRYCWDEDFQTWVWLPERERVK